MDGIEQSTPDTVALAAADRHGSKHCNFAGNFELLSGRRAKRAERSKRHKEMRLSRRSSRTCGTDCLNVSGERMIERMTSKACQPMQCAKQCLCSRAPRGDSAPEDVKATSTRTRDDSILPFEPDRERTTGAPRAQEGLQDGEHPLQFEPYSVQARRLGIGMAKMKGGSGRRGAADKELGVSEDAAVALSSSKQVVNKVSPAQIQTQCAGLSCAGFARRVGAPAIFSDESEGLLGQVESTGQGAAHRSSLTAPIGVHGQPLSNGLQSAWPPSTHYYTKESEGLPMQVQSAEQGYAHRSSPTARTGVQGQPAPANFLKGKSSEQDTDHQSPRWGDFIALQSEIERRGVSHLKGSTLDVDLFTEKLDLLVRDGDFSRSDADYLRKGITWGFDLGVDESKLPGKAVLKNYKSAFDNKQKVTDALAARVTAGKTLKLGAFDGNPDDLPGESGRVVPNGAVAKKLEADKVRPFSDHTKTGLNPASDAARVAHKLDTCREVEEALRPGHCMRIEDVDAAFPILPLAPRIWKYMYVWWYDVDRPLDEQPAQHALRACIR